MSIKNHDKQQGQAPQLRASASNGGKNAAVGFSAVNPIQKKEDAVQRTGDKLDEELPAASLKADPAQLMKPDEEMK